MHQVETIVQTVHYVLSVIGQANKLKIVKLLYIADKYNLQRFGRTITGDTYVAMKRGPVGSLTKNILDFDLDRLETADVDYARRFLALIGDFDYRAKRELCNYEMLSLTDKESLGFVVRHFGRWGHGKLIDLTHTFPEWSQYQVDFAKEARKSAPIPTEQLFLRATPDPLGLPADLVAESRRLYNGEFC